MTHTRRHTLRLATASLTAALAKPPAPRAQGARELVIITYPGRLSEPHRWLADQMEARHPGLRIRLVPSDSQDVVAQIKASLGYSPFDAMPNDEPPHLIGIRDGYVQLRADAALRNIAAVYPSLLGRSQGHGVPATYSLVGIAYNTQMVRDPPQAWADLWRPEFKGRVGIARTSSNLGLATLAIAARLSGGSDDNLEPGWDKLKQLGAVAARSPATLGQMLEREEIAVAPLWNNAAAAAAAKGLPIGFVMPRPGAVAIVSFMSAVTGTRHPDLATEWLDGIISPAYQARAAAAPYYFGPTTRGVEVPADARAYTPSTPDEIQALQTIDWARIVPVRGQLVERFDRTFAM